MLYELREILEELEKIDKKLQTNTYKEGEIQKRIRNTSDFPEILNNIQEETLTLQQLDKHELARMIKIAIDLNAKLSSCVNNIELTRDLVQKLINHLSGKKLHKDDA